MCKELPTYLHITDMKPLKLCEQHITQESNYTSIKKQYTVDARFNTTTVVI
jgi:hypothetical protein